MTISKCTHKNITQKAKKQCICCFFSSQSHSEGKYRGPSTVTHKLINGYLAALMRQTQTLEHRIYKFKCMEMRGYGVSIQDKQFTSFCKE